MKKRTKCRPAPTSYQRNGTYLRVLIAVPADSLGTIDLHNICNDLALGTTRIVVLAAPTLGDLDRHTERLQRSARIEHWELVSADGMHKQIINTITANNQQVSA
jgi:branched-subunit amino acid aminotransferase/4-amino-4-deoxychorismate lyase